MAVLHRSRLLIFYIADDKWYFLHPLQCSDGLYWMYPRGRSHPMPMLLASDAVMQVAHIITSRALMD